MTPTTFVEASTTLLAQLASPAARALPLAIAARLVLAAFRVKATNVRLVTWTAVLYTALAMPLLGWVLPSLPIPTPSFVQSMVQSVRQNRIFHATAEQASATENSPAEAAKRHKNAAHSLPRASRGGVSLGIAQDMDKLQRAERLTLAHASDPVTSEVPASSWSLRSEPATKAPTVTDAISLSFLSSISASTLAAGTYLAVALFLFARFFVGLAFSRRLLRVSQIIDDPRLIASLASRAHASGLAFLPPVAESEFISVPVTMGALRSTILLPTTWHEWDNAKLDAVIAHEVSHVARRDALTQRVSLLHRAIFWFSPLAWWLDRHLANLAEQASDEAALSCGADRRRYATTLLEFFEALQAAPGRVWWQGVSMAKAGQAEKRVERILSWKGTVTMGFKESSFKKSGFKKAIVIAAVALAVPVVYLAASARPANSNAKPQNVYLAHDQTPPARLAPAPQAQPSSTPAPAAAPAQDMTPPPEPSAQPEPAPAPHAAVGTITGTLRGGIAAVPPAPGVAPVAAIAPSGPHAFAVLAPVAPIAPLSPPAPLAVLTGQSGTSHSSRGRGFSYAYGYDDSQRFVIASGKTDSLTMSGSTEDAEHVERLRKTIPGDFIWFERDEKSYIIRDQATIDRARKFWEPQEELGKKQEALGKQQEVLGAQQEELGKKMEQVRVAIPDMTEDLDKLKAELKQLSSSATMEQIGNLQSEIGDLQSKLGDLQSKAGDQQSKLGEEMGSLGDKQGKLGDEQGKLGDQQAELARQATRQMKQLLDEAITKGTAQPEP